MLVPIASKITKWLLVTKKEGVVKLVTKKRGGVVNESPLILNDESNSPVAPKLRNSCFPVAVSLRIL